MIEIFFALGILFSPCQLISWLTMLKSSLVKGCVKSSVVILVSTVKKV